MDGVAEACLVLDQPFEPIEIAPGAVLDQRAHKSTIFLAAGGGLGRSTAPAPSSRPLPRWAHPPGR